MNLSEYLQNLNFPADFRRSLEILYFRENSCSWSIISAVEISDSRTANFFEPSTISALEKRLTLDFEEAMTNGKVCFANTEEVRPDFRTSFTAEELLNYIFVMTLGNTPGENYLPFPEGPDQFWELVQLGQKKKDEK